MKKIKAALSNNFGMKVMSVVLAFVLWFVVVQIDDPTNTVTFNNVPVNLINTDALDSNDKVYQILENSDTVRVTVRAPKSVTDSLKATDVIAEADFNKMTEVNTVVITYGLLSGGNYKSITGNHDTVVLQIEDKKVKHTNLRVETTGAVAEGYVLGNVSADQNRLDISGPESSVNKVDHALAVLDVTDADRNLSTNVEILLYDKSNQLIDDPLLKKQISYVRVNAEVLGTKQVPIYASQVGTPADGYKYAGEISVSPATITVAAGPSTLNTLSRITVTDSVDITGAMENVEQEVEISNYLPGNVRMVGDFDGKAVITVYVEKIISKVLYLRSSSISLVNVPEGEKVSLAEENRNIALTVSGLAGDIAAMEDAGVTGTIDLGKWMEENDIDALTEGSYVVPVNVVEGKGVDVMSNVTVELLVEKDI